MPRVKPTKRNKSLEDSLLEQRGPMQQAEPGNEWERFLLRVQQSPGLYVGGVIFIGLAIVAGLTINMGVAAAKRSEATAFARAMAEEDQTLRGQALESAAAAAGDFGDDALFAAGNAFYAAGEYEKAGEAYARVISDYPESDLLGEAYEGLGYVAEEQGEFEQAIAQYTKALETTGTFASKRQDFNIGRVHERLKDFTAAKQAYEAQVINFPGSVVAQNATAALTRLQETYPELFPQEVASEPQDTGVESSTEESTASGNLEIAE